MSFDLRIAVKVDGTDIMAQIAEPEHANPTYNIGNLFRACTGWDFRQSEYYKCEEVLPKILHGIDELRMHPSKYKKYEPDNGWGSVEGALSALKSLRDCIADVANDYPGIPIEHLWVAW